MLKKTGPLFMPFMKTFLGGDFFYFSMLASSADFILEATHFWCGFFYFDIIHCSASTPAFHIVLDPEIHTKNAGEGILFTGSHGALFLAKKC